MRVLKVWQISEDSWAWDACMPLNNGLGTAPFIPDVATMRLQLDQNSKVVAFSLLGEILICERACYRTQIKDIAVCLQTAEDSLCLPIKCASKAPCPVTASKISSLQSMHQCVGSCTRYASWKGKVFTKSANQLFSLAMACSTTEILQQELKSLLAPESCNDWSWGKTSPSGTTSPLPQTRMVTEG